MLFKEMGPGDRRPARVGWERVRLEPEFREAEDPTHKLMEAYASHLQESNGVDTMISHLKCVYILIHTFGQAPLHTATVSTPETARAAFLHARNGVPGLQFLEAFRVCAIPACAGLVITRTPRMFRQGCTHACPRRHLIPPRTDSRRSLCPSCGKWLRPLASAPFLPIAGPAPVVRVKMASRSVIQAKAEAKHKKIRCGLREPAAQPQPPGWSERPQAQLHWTFQRPEIHKIPSSHDATLQAKSAKESVALLRKGSLMRAGQIAEAI
jgi:hypothetical protein